MREHAHAQSNPGHDAPARPVLPAPRPIQYGAQAKLTVGGAGDAHEREADRFAEELTGAHHSGRQSAGAAARTTAPPVAGEAAKSNGQPLAPQTRTFMEGGFGHDFGRVRVHADGGAATAARSVGARAYTLGDDIVFGAGEYQPATREGQRLIAHELTHVLQQSAAPGVIQREPSDEAAAPAAGQTAQAAAAPVVPLGTVLPFTPEGQAPGWDGAAILGTGQIEATSALGKAITSGPQAVQALADSVYAELGKEMGTKTDVDGYVVALGDAAIAASVIKDGITNRDATYGQLRNFAVMLAALDNTGDRRQLSLLVWASQPTPEKGAVGNKAPEGELRQEMYRTLNRWKGTKEGSKTFDEGFMSPDEIKTQRQNSSKQGRTFTTCVEFLGRAQTLSASNANVLLKKSINNNVAVKEEREKMGLPPGAWHDAAPGMTRRPKPGDIYFLSFAQHVYKEGKPKRDENIKYYKGSFSHVGFVLSITKSPAYGPGGAGTEVWETVDGGQGTAGKYKYEGLDEKKKEKYTMTQKGAERIDKVMRIYHPDTNLITGESNQDTSQRSLLGWVDIDKLQGDYTT